MPTEYPNRARYTILTQLEREIDPSIAEEDRAQWKTERIRAKRINYFGRQK